MKASERKQADLKAVQKRDRKADYQAISLNTGQPYRGKDNQALLAAAARAKGYIAPHWGTYRGWMSAGCQVKLDEKATRVYSRDRWHSVYNFQQVAVQDPQNEKAIAALDFFENAAQDATEDAQEAILSEVMAETSDERYQMFLDYMETHQDGFADGSMAGVCEDLGIGPDTVKHYRMRAGRDAAKTGVRPLWMVGPPPKTRGLSRREREEIRNQAAGVPF